MTTTTFTVSGATLLRAGDGVSTALKGGGADMDTEAGTATETYVVDEWIVEAENFINLLCRYDFTANYLSLNANTKQILREAATCLAAMYAVSFDMGGYTSLAEAETIIDVCRDGAERALGLLVDQKSVTYVKQA